MYDENNIFAKLLRDEIPSKRILETAHSISFYNTRPEARIHALVIPRGAYTNIYDFTLNAPDAEQKDFWAAVRETADKLGISENFQALANTGTDSGQTIFHFHIHLLAR